MHFVLLILIGIGLAASPAWARKTNEPIYEDPFDLAAGGASLTRASKEGVLFSNPALLPLASGFVRWTGLTATVLTNKEAVSTSEGLAKSAKGGGSGSSSTSDTTALVNQLFKNPVRAGWGLAFSFLSKKFGVAAFSRFELDLQAKSFGSTGIPQVELQTESYHGLGLGTAIRTPMRWLIFGITAKYLYAGEQDVRADVSDQAALTSFANPKMVQNFSALNTGAGADAAMLIFLQGSAVDLTMAGKVDDLGGTNVSGKSAQPNSFKQVESAGLGLTFHTTADAIHFAADYRDIAGVYGEPTFKRVYAGTKVTLRTHLGVAAGFYNGYPSMGAELDLFFCRVAVTSYTRELGDRPGVAPRHIYMASFSLGF